MIPTEELGTLVAARSVNELWELHSGHMAEYGFDRLIYGFTYYMTETSFGDPDDFLLLSNHDPDYLKVYVGDRLYLNAPMVRWAMENDGPCSWSVLSRLEADGALSEDEREVLDFNRSMGIVAGYSISFQTMSSRAKGAIALTGRKGLSQADIDDIWKRDGQDILLRNNLFHLRLMSLPHTGTARTLTPRQREVLEWVGDGKTVQDIALLMGLTQPTVEKHLRLARQTLRVETTAQALLKAAFQNQIFALER